MQQTRLTAFLRSLSRNEMKTFADFISSPVFNKNELIKRLLELYSSAHPDFESPELTAEKIFGLVFGDKKFDYFKLKNLESDLLALGKEFLAFINFRNDANRKEIDILSESSKRRLDQIFDATYKSAKKRSESVKRRDENWYMHRLNLTNSQIGHRALSEPDINLKLLQLKLDNFADYALIVFLRIYNQMLHDMHQFNHKYDLKLFDQVMIYLKENEKHNNVTVELLYLMILLDRERNDENYFRLYEHRKRHKDELMPLENYFAFLLLDGYCAYCYNNYSRTDLLRQQFELTKECDINLHPEVGKVLYPDFVYTVKIAARVGEYRFAEEYIDKYNINLTEEKENTINFCRAIVSAGKDNYDEALELLAKVNFSDFILKIQVKILALQTIFNKGDYEQARLMIDSFRHYLSREKLLIKEHKSILLEFLKITMEMISVKTSAHASLTKIQNLELQTNNLEKNFLGTKLWLLSKLEELGKK